MSEPGAPLVVRTALVRDAPSIAAIGRLAFPVVDRFAVMRRLGVDRVATFVEHVAVHRFGPGRRRAFEILA